MIPIKFFILVNQSKESLVAIFEENEFDLLKEFYSEIERIRKHSDFMNEFSVSMNFHAEINKPVISKFEFPDDSKVMIALHLLRPIVLKKEPLYFNLFTNILKRRLNNEYIQKFIDNQKELFSGVAVQKQLIVESRDAIINSEAFFLKYLNAFEYHRDQDKRKYFKEIFNTIPEDFARFFIVSLIIDKYKAISNIGYLTGILIGKTKEFNIL